MSRGLGKVERAILEAMQARPDREYWTKALCIHVYRPDEYDSESGDYGPFCNFTEAQRKSVLRAAASLERKGFIKSTVRTFGCMENHFGDWGGRAWEKEYVLTSR